MNYINISNVILLSRLNFAAFVKETEPNKGTLKMISICGKHILVEIKWELYDHRPQFDWNDKSRDINDSIATTMNLPKFKIKISNYSSDIIFGIFETLGPFFK